jgi:hypothetical protein
MSLDTEAGLLTISRAGLADYDAVIAIMREAADWLSARGNPQWKHWHMEVGERLLEWAVDTIAARGRLFARLDAMASNAALCRYYEERGFRPLDTAKNCSEGCILPSSSNENCTNEEAQPQQNSRRQPGSHRESS